jgi:hypothetical protein
MRLIEQLQQILETRSDLDLEERLILKTAISWLDQRDYWALSAEQNEPYDWDAHPWRVRLTLGEFEQLELQQFGTQELLDGQPAGKLNWPL